MKTYLVCVQIFLLLLAFSSQSYAANNYSRGKAIEYASERCGTGTSPDKGYNYAQYVCYNGDKPECRADNPWLTTGSKVDCANFVSQAMINGGIDFSGCPGVTNIGKGSNAGKKGIVNVEWLRIVLITGSCFEVISDSAQMRAKAKPGDILSSRET